MKLYNTLTRQLETFTPQDPQNVKIYTCGPTVYDYAHIGNFTAYIYWDLLVRTLTLSGYTVNRVLNFTDVGHLTSDEDEGEDKLEKGATREGKTVWEIAEFYEQAFLQDFRALQLTEPTKICRATDYIQQGTSLVNTLSDQGYTYETNDGIYFDTAKFPSYANFARLDLDHLRAGVRVTFNSQKRNASDFAVWKFIQPGENHAMRWDYLGRPGYPGWHLECSTIIHAELGETIDIHTGGIDHIPVHHTNEIAQSEAAFSKTLSNYWLHANFISIDGQKISKSLSNTYTLADLAKRGFTPHDFKMWVLQGHFQSDRNFSFDDLAAAKTRLLGWRNKIALTYQKDLPPTIELKDTILGAVANNLNSAAAFSIIDAADPDYATWEFIDQLFGLGLIASTPDINDNQKALLRERQQARKAKDFAKSDQIRSELEEQGIIVLDAQDGTIWQYTS